VETRLNINERTFRSTSCEFTRRDRPWQHQSVYRVGLVIFIFALWPTGFATASQPPQKSANRTDSSRGEFSDSFQVSRSDLAKAEVLANQLAALSPRVDRTEATLLADCAYATVSRLRRQYSMFGTPIFNNFLIYHGLRKRGYCYQWGKTCSSLLMHCDSPAWSCAGVKPTRATGARTIVSSSLPKDGHSGAASCWSPGAILDTYISVQLWQILIHTWRTARTLASFWPDQQLGILPAPVIASLFR